MSKPFDFFPDFRDFNRYLSEDLAWQVVNGEFFNIDNMTDLELRQSIVDDVLSITMWEKQTEQQVVFDVNTLCRLLTHEQRVRVKEAIQHPDIAKFFSADKEIRILETQEILQSAMAYCGVWFTGYDCPNDIISLNREALEEAIETNGGIDNLVMGMAMDLNATHESSKTLN